MKKEIKKIEKKTQKPIITARILFISVLDKIFLGILGLYFIIGTISIFKGHIGSLSYGYFGRIGHEIIFLVILFIFYLLLNWIYKCAAKTMLCLTKNEVYKEVYFPFKRMEATIPINKITAVSTINLFWIFRAIIIHQYHAFPLVFFTWNNQEFKVKLNEILINEKDPVENEYEDKNIITDEMYQYIKYIGITLAGLILLLGIVRFFAYTFNGERQMAGTYTNEANKITLNKNGTCSLGVIDRVTECKWIYNSNSKEIKVSYEYEYSYYYNRYTSTSKGTLILKYNTSDKSLEYQGMKFTK